MIGRRFPSASTQGFRDRLRGLARQAIDDARLAGTIPDKRLDLVDPVDAGEGLQEDVGALETGAPGFRLAQFQLLTNVCLGGLVRRSCEGEDRRLGQQSREPGQLRILGTEIVSPDRHAMRFIDGHKRYALRGDEIEKPGRQRPLRGHIEDLEQARPDLAVDLIPLRRCGPAMQRAGFDPSGPQRIHLVVHQGDEGRDDERETRHEQCRQLVAQ